MIINNITKWRVNILMNNRRLIAQEFADNIKSDNIQQIILFGSVARGDDTVDSDIDILIITLSEKEISNRVDDEVLNIISKYHEVISAHLMSTEIFNKTKHFSFLSNVLKEGVMLVG